MEKKTVTIDLNGTEISIGVKSSDAISCLKEALRYLENENESVIPLIKKDEDRTVGIHEYDPMESHNKCEVEGRFFVTTSTTPEHCFTIEFKHLCRHLSFRGLMQGISRTDVGRIVIREENGREFAVLTVADCGWTTLLDIGEPDGTYKVFKFFLRSNEKADKVKFRLEEISQRS